MCIAVGLLSWGLRETLNRRVEGQGARPGEWVTHDPDSLYHMRRVERALDDGLPPAEFDPLLNAPHGSAIPWPPYYTWVVTGLLAPFVPDDPATGARHAWIEMRVATLATVFSVLASLVAAAVVWRWGGPLAALAAGSYHALCLSSVVYGKVGNGDHHAFVSLVSALMLGLLSAALARGALDRARRGWLWGLGLGLLAALALGSWVASLLYVIEVQLVLAIVMLSTSDRERPGLAPLGLGFHLTALALVLPAVLSSPWRDLQPWQVVNLSWFHPAFLFAGALVFVPLGAFERHAKARRVYPWIVGATLLVAGVALAWLDSGPAKGLREGFAWMSRMNLFMSGISESRPLIGPGAGWDALTELGFGLLVLPVGWWILGKGPKTAAWLATMPWIVGSGLRALQAARQARFAEALAVPLAVVIGLTIARVWPRRQSPSRRALWGAGVLALVVACHPRTASNALAEWRGTRAPQARRDGPAVLGARDAARWIAQQGGPEGAVLASWSHGHTFEWEARRPTLGTNFGSYVGEDAFRAAPAFFLSSSEADGLALLDRHGVRYVVVTSELPRGTRRHDRDRRSRRCANASSPESPETSSPRGSRRSGARLLFGGRRFEPNGSEDGGSVAGLRLVHVTPRRDPRRPLRGPRDLSPAASVWERVPGAVLEAKGAPGEWLRVQLRVRFAEARKTIEFVASAVAGRTGNRPGTGALRNARRRR